MAELLISLLGNAPVALCIWFLASEVKGIRIDLKQMRTKEECNERHGRSCERLTKVEEDIKELMKK